MKPAGHKGLELPSQTPGLALLLQNHHKQVCEKRRQGWPRGGWACEDQAEKAAIRILELIPAQETAPKNPFSLDQQSPKVKKYLQRGGNSLGKPETVT